MSLPRRIPPSPEPTSIKEALDRYLALKEEYTQIRNIWVSINDAHRRLYDEYQLLLTSNPGLDVADDPLVDEFFPEHMSESEFLQGKLVNKLIASSERVNRANGRCSTVHARLVAARKAWVRLGGTLSKEDAREVALENAWLWVERP
jgi:hypothetical protein